MMVLRCKVFFSIERLKKVYRESHLKDFFFFVPKELGSIDRGYEVSISVSEEECPEKEAFFHLEKEMASAMDIQSRHSVALPGYRFAISYKRNDFDSGTRFGMLKPVVRCKENIFISGDLIKKLCKKSADEEVKEEGEKKASLADRLRLSLYTS